MGRHKLPEEQMKALQSLEIGGSFWLSFYSIIFAVGGRNAQ